MKYSGQSTFNIQTKEVVPFVLALLKHERITLSLRAFRAHSARYVCCVVIATLFVGSAMGVQMTSAIAFLFVVAVLALIGGLLSLLREIYIATGSIRRVGNQE